MPANEIIRQYTMSDATLVQMADSLLDVAREDVDQLTPFGIGADSLDAIKAQRDAFMDMESDAIWRGRLRTVTARKAESEKALRSNIREIMLHAKMKLGANSPEYSTFGTVNVARANDNELVRIGKTVRKVAEEFAEELALPQDSSGNIPLLIDLDANRSSFDDLIDDQKSVIRKRDRATQSRRKAGNELYSELSRLASLGRELFADDEAHANDYRISIRTARAAEESQSTAVAAKTARLLADNVTEDKRVMLTNNGPNEVYYDFKDIAETGLDPNTAERLEPGATVDFDGEPEMTYLHLHNFSSQDVTINYLIE